MNVRRHRMRFRHALAFGCVIVAVLNATGYAINLFAPQRFEWFFYPSSTGPQAIFRELNIWLFGGPWGRITAVEYLIRSPSRPEILWRKHIPYLILIAYSQGRNGPVDDVRELEMNVDLPAASIIFGTYPVFLLIRGPLLRHHRRKRGLCIYCTYNLTGNVSGVCPECGTKT